jgi:hypothetical protein
LKKNILFLLLTFLLTSFSFESKADWINLSGAENARNIAEIYIENDQVTIKLEVFVQDLLIFEELVPDDFFPEPVLGRPGTDERIQTFADSVFQIITDKGEKLSAKLLLAEPRMRINRPSPLVGSINPYTRQRIPGPPEDKRVLYAELIYPFKGHPKSLTIIPPLSDNGFPKASIGFICYHLGVPVVDFRQLTVQNNLHLEWDDPWYSAFEKKPLKRALQSGVRTYLYIEPYEVRHEILVRVKDMMTWMDFDLRGDEYIEEDEFNPVREKMARFFMDREKVMIDGKKGKPILDRTAYVESSMLRSRFIEIPERVPLNTAMVGIIITYLTNTIAGEVVTQWDLFSDRVQKVTASMVDPAGPFPYDLTPDANVLKWTNYLKTYTMPTVDKIPVDATHMGIFVPLGSLVCMVLLLLCTFLVFRRRQKSQPVKVQLALMLVLLVGIVVLFPQFHVSVGGGARASQISEDESKVITLSLLENVYRAFDFRDEEDVYDKLAISVDGDLLTDIYLQSRKSLVIEQAGGAQAKIKKVAVLETEVQEADKNKGVVAIRTKWTAIGSVGHWGHLHTRQNVYDAILTLAVADGFWKISGIDLLEEKRVDSIK